MDNVGIALKTCHESRFVDAGAGMVPFLSSVVASIFTSKYLWTLAVIFVIAVPLVLEPRDGTIEVFIDEVGFLAFHGFPANLEVVTFGIRTTGANNLNFGMSLAHGVGNYLHTFEIGISPLLVANGQQLHVEGSGVSHVGTQLSPFGVCASVGKLNEVEAVVDEWLQSFDGGWSMSVITILELAGHAHIQYGQGFGTNLFTQEEEFVEAETIALEIVGIVAIGEGALPAILVNRTILDRTYGVFPVVAVFQRYAFNDATTGETEYSRLHVGKSLSQVFTHTVFVSLPSVNREQADVLYINCTTSTASVLLAHKQSQLSFVDSAIGF